ncbi:hypothetical protein I79_011618 [Cricetulus griseus]|uniref:Uncharacterized protein n=1 Tax=Cricetulus griseus TaxID=10029 RepID=G3HLM7_CRIGR|nr:hypothetical protein I79_011618 [Cricetulus griseus]
MHQVHRPTSRGCEKQQPSNYYSNHQLPWDRLDGARGKLELRAWKSLSSLALKIAPIEPRLPQWPGLERHQPLLETPKVCCPTWKFYDKGMGFCPLQVRNRK